MPFVAYEYNMFVVICMFPAAHRKHSYYRYYYNYYHYIITMYTITLLFVNICLHLFPAAHRVPGAEKGTSGGLEGTACNVIYRRPII